MNFFKRFIYSFNYKKYDDLVHTTTTSTVLYHIVIYVIVFLLSVGMYAMPYVSMGRAEGIVEKYVPEFSIDEDGFHCYEKINYDHGVFKIIVDENLKRKEVDFSTTPFGIFINNKGMYVYSYNDFEVMPFDDFDGMQIDKDILLEISPYIDMLMVLIVIIGIFYSLLISFFSLSIPIAIAYIIKGVKGVRISFEDTLKLCIYANSATFILKLFQIFLGSLSTVLALVIVVFFIYKYLDFLRKKDGIILAEIGE